MGTDEYWTGITRYVPAQERTYQNMLKDDDVKSPTQMIPLVWTSHRALDLGIKSPYGQYRFVQISLGLIGLFLILWGLHRYLRKDELPWVLLTMGFYFAAPFALTRPMYESLSAPFVLWSALSLTRYRQTSALKEILISTLMISLAFALRPQTGIAALAIPALALVKKDGKGFTAAALLGLVLFILLGIPDWTLRGSWHYSLQAILFYNVEFGASYAQQPWFYYILLTIGLLWGPFWISKHFPATFKKYWDSQLIHWIFIFLILGLHSFFPQKWERFVIPVLPLLILILSDWIKEFWQAGHQKRLWGLLAVNLLFWFPSSFFPAQQNIISLSLHLDQHPEIKTLHRLNNNPQWITEAFIRRQDWRWSEAGSPPESLSCSERLVMNQKDFQSLSMQNLEIDQIFETNFLEKLAYKMNPGKNQRRTPLYLLKAKGC